MRLICVPMDGEKFWINPDHVVCFRENDQNPKQTMVTFSMDIERPHTVIDIDALDFMLLMTAGGEIDFTRGEWIPAAKDDDLSADSFDADGNLKPFPESPL